MHVEEGKEFLNCMLMETSDWHTHMLYLPLKNVRRDSLKCTVFVPSSENLYKVLLLQNLFEHYYITMSKVRYTQQNG